MENMEPNTPLSNPDLVPQDQSHDIEIAKLEPVLPPTTLFEETDDVVKETKNIDDEMESRKLEERILEWKDKIENDDTINMLTLAFMHSSPSAYNVISIKHHGVKLFLFLTFLAQILIPLFLFTYYQGRAINKCLSIILSKQEEESGEEFNKASDFWSCMQSGYFACPQDADDTLKVLSFCICCIYVSRLCMLAMKYWGTNILPQSSYIFNTLIGLPKAICQFCSSRDRNQNDILSRGVKSSLFIDTGMMNHPTTRFGTNGGYLQLFQAVDIFMCTAYESFVYVLNVMIVFVTSGDPTEVIFNAMAFEFVLSLDNQMKDLYLQTFEMNRSRVLKFMKYNGEKTTIGQNEKESVKEIPFLLWCLVAIFLDFTNLCVCFGLLFIMVNFFWMPTCIGKEGSLSPEF